MNKHEIITFLGAYKESLLLTDEDIRFLNDVEEDPLFIQYLRCLLVGITLEEVRSMKEHGLTPDLVRKKASEILGGLYREEDPLTKDVLAMQQRIETELTYSKELHDLLAKRLQESWNSEREALKETIQAKQDIISRLEKERDALQSASDPASCLEPLDLRLAYDFPEKPKRRKRFFQRSNASAGDDTEYSKQKEFEEQQFRDHILRNPEYSKEQKDYLLSCFNGGMSYWTLVRFAHPDLPVEFMKAMKERREREGY